MWLIGLVRFPYFIGLIGQGAIQANSLKLQGCLQEQYDINPGAYRDPMRRSLVWLVFEFDIGKLQRF